MYVTEQVGKRGNSQPRAFSCYRPQSVYLRAIKKGESVITATALIKYLT